VKVSQALYAAASLLFVGGVIAEIREYTRWKATESELWRAAAEADATGKLADDLAKDVPGASDANG
jgi:hypothetical protein